MKDQSFLTVIISLRIGILTAVRTASDICILDIFVYISFTYDIFLRMFKSERCLLYLYIISEFGVLCLSFIGRYVGYFKFSKTVEGTMMLDFNRNKKNQQYHCIRHRNCYKRETRL